MKSREIKKFRKDYTKYEKNCVFEGYRLAVLFDEKDDVKQYGGRWDADEQTWWMPEKKLLNEIHDNGTLVRDWLNDNEMIIGQYGEFKGNKLGWDGEAREVYTLAISSHESYTPEEFIVNWFEKLDAVEFNSSVDGESEWYTKENARTRWDELVKEGYNRVEKP